jgi:hypothetical protein
MRSSSIAGMIVVERRYMWKARGCMWCQIVSSGSDSYVQPHYTGNERRASSRIQTPFPVVVRSVEVNEQPFEEHSILDNLGSCGLYLPLTRRVRDGVILFVLIRFSVSHDADASVAWIELYGKVLRTEPRPGGLFGTAIRFTHRRFIYATTQSIGHYAGHWFNHDIPGCGVHDRSRLLELEHD